MQRYASKCSFATINILTVQLQLEPSPSTPFVVFVQGKNGPAIERDGQPIPRGINACQRSC
eukprot:scaffold24801_cov181-Cylindrotheca_fusiformis.AAC.5